jgi:predicted PurR-regulated permease PerM
MMDQPTKWSKELRYLALLSLIIAVIVLARFFREIFNPIAIAALLAYVLYPIVKFLTERTRLSHGAAVLIVYILSLLLLASTPAIITPVAVSQVRLLYENIESLLTHYSELRTTTVHFMNRAWDLAEYLPDVPGISTDMLSPLAEGVFAVVGAVTKNFLSVMVILVSYYYLLLDGYRLGEIFIRVVPESHQADMRRILERLRYIWSDYMRSQLLFMFAVGLMDSVAWFAVGLPGAIFLGLFTGLTSFVHEIGAVISGVLSVLVAILEGSNFFTMSNFWFAILVLIIYLILTGIKNIWLRPIIVGRTAHIHPGIVFVVVIGALLFHGALAAFLVVPVLLSIYEIAKYLRCQILGIPPFQDDTIPAEIDLES